jgi:signal transduction histidine kinase
VSPGSRSPSPATEDELRLPRPPGLIRRFWSRHPVLADILIALAALLLSVGPATTFRSTGAPAPELQAVSFALIPLSIAASALLLRRRQWPVTVFVASLVLALAFLFAPNPVGTPLVLVTSYSLAVYRSSRAAWLGFGIGIGTLAVLSLLLSLTGAVPVSHSANAVVGELVLALIGTLIGVNVGNRKRYLEAIIDRSRQLLVERDQQAQLAASAERARIAREMHDIVSHSLTVIVALSEGATATPDAGRARAASTQVAETARSALREMRSMLGVLRDETGATAPLTPLDDDAAPQAVASARSAGFPVTLRTVTAADGHKPIPPAVRLATARIVQEALTNAMRHAPGATAIEVTLTTGARDVQIEVRNDAVREPARDGGYGLTGLRERADHLGGTFAAGPDDRGGWRVHARLPIPELPSSADSASASVSEEKP